jgi:predicted nucleic acid-binding protein
MRTKVVVDASPLIALSIVGKLDLLKKIFDEIYIPEKVYREVVVEGEGLIGAEEIKSAKWIKVRKVEMPSLYSPSTTGIDEGEIKVLALAKKIDADFAIIDEHLGRNAAKALDIPIKGTLGVLLIAYYRKLVSKDGLVKVIDKLKNSDIRISHRLYNWFIKQL